MLASVGAYHRRQIHAVPVPWITGELGRVRHARAAGRRSQRPHPPRTPAVVAGELGAIRMAVGVDPGRSTPSTATSRTAAAAFIRHYIFDFGTSLGSSTVTSRDHTRQASTSGGRAGRWAALAGLGPYRRPFQDRRARVEESWSRGTLRPADRGRGFRPRRLSEQPAKCPPPCARDRDVYWGSEAGRLVQRTPRSMRWCRGSRFPERDAHLDRTCPARPAGHHRPALPAGGRADRKPARVVRRQPRLLRGRGRGHGYA